MLLRLVVPFAAIDPPAPQPDSHAALARTVGPPHNVTSQDTRRNDSIYFMPRVVPSQRLSVCIRKRTLNLSLIHGVSPPHAHEMSPKMLYSGLHVSEL